MDGLHGWMLRRPHCKDTFHSSQPGLRPCSSPTLPFDSTMTQSELRHRKLTNKKKLRGKDDKNKSTGDGSAAPRLPQEPETLWETFRSHPLVMVTPYIAIPYFLWRCVHFVALRRPDILVGLVHLRPAVQMHELRQVLILGSIASGTKQVTEGLSKVLKLEISHESTNSLEVGRLSESRIDDDFPDIFLTARYHHPLTGFHEGWNGIQFSRYSLRIHGEVRSRSPPTDANEYMSR